MDVLDATVHLLNFLVIPSFAYACQLSLGAVGVTLVYGVLRFSNFAHGETMALGTTFCLLITWGLQGLGITAGVLPTALLALPLAAALTALVLLASDATLYRFNRRKNAKPEIMMIVSAGLMLVMNGVVGLIIGPSDRSFDDGTRFLVTARGFRAWSGLAEPLAIKSMQVITVVVAVAVCLALFWFLMRTRTGKSMRAFADNRDLALLCGANPDRIATITWVIVAVLTTVAGTLFGLDKSFKPFVYEQLLLPIFAAAIVGGLGSLIGAIAGGMIVAFSEVALTFSYKKVLTYLLPAPWAPEGLVQLLTTEYKYAVSFVILVLVLLVNPTGLFGRATR